MRASGVAWGGGGSRLRLLRVLLPIAASLVVGRMDLLRVPSPAASLDLVRNLLYGVPLSTHTAPPSTLELRRVRTCWRDWLLPRTAHLPRPLDVLNAERRTGAPLLATMQWPQFVGEAARLGPRRSGEEAWRRLPAAHLLASAGRPCRT